jgi:hypothetical protein
MHRSPQEPHRSKPLLHVGSLIYSLFPIKTTWVPDSYFTTERTRLTHHEGTTETHSDLNGSSQQWQKTHNPMRQVVVIQYYTGTCKNNASPKITLSYNSTRETCYLTTHKNTSDTCKLFLGKKTRRVWFSKWPIQLRDHHKKLKSIQVANQFKIKKFITLDILSYSVGIERKKWEHYGEVLSVRLSVHRYRLQNLWTNSDNIYNREGTLKVVKLN